MASSSKSAVSALARPILSASTASSSRVISTSSPISASLSPTSASTSTSTAAQPPKYLDFPPHTPLPRPYGIHVASLHLAAHHPYPLDLYTSFAVRSASSLGIPTSNPASLPTTTSLYTVIKSPFVHKKAQENFERRTHRRVIKVWDSDRGVVDLWLRYLRKNGIGGVGMKAYVHEWVEYGYGAKEIGELEKQLDRPGQEVEKVAEELVKALSADVDVGEAPGKGGEMVKADGQELVEGPDDVVAGEELPSSNPEGRAESLPNKQPEVKDVGEPPKP